MQAIHATPKKMHALKSHLHYLSKSFNALGLKRVVIETSSLCNYRCSFCWTIESTRKKGLMSWETFIKAMDGLKGLNVEEISLSYGGEPLLNKRVYDMIREIKRREYYVYMTTNAEILTKEASQKLIDAGIDKVEVSFHATTRETYKQVFLKDNYDLVIQNVKNLYDLRGNRKTPEIRINYYVMDINKDEFVKTHPLKDYIDDANVWAVIDSPTAGVKDHSIINNPVRISPCMWILTQINLLSNGDISLGCNLDGNAKLVVGNVYDGTVKQAFMSERAREIKRLFFQIGISEEKRRKIFKEFPACMTCFDEIRFDSGSLKKKFDDANNKNFHANDKIKIIQ